MTSLFSTLRSTERVFISVVRTLENWIIKTRTTTTTATTKTGSRDRIQNVFRQFNCFRELQIGFDRALFVCMCACALVCLCIWQRKPECLPRLLTYCWRLGCKFNLSSATSENIAIGRYGKRNQIQMCYSFYMSEVLYSEFLLTYESNRMNV